MRLLPLLTSFRGRIGRQSWWIGFAIWLTANIAGGYTLNAEFLTADEIPPPNWSDTLWQLACLVLLAAVTVKRCNDRDWPSWLGYVFPAVYAVYIVAVQFGVSIDPQAPGIGKAMFWSLAAFQLAMLIDNGFLRGTDGPNRHGPDPLAASVETP